MNRVALLAIALVGTGASQPGGPPPQPVATDTLVITYQPDEERDAPLVIDELAPQTVLTIRAGGFDADTSGVIEQCVRGESRRCRNRLRVRFDDEGAATFQYLVTDDFGGSDSDDQPCRLGGARCTIELETGSKTAVVETVFVDRAPPAGRLEVTPRDGLLVGDSVTVTASQLPSDAELTVMICAEPSTQGSRCGAPGPEVPIVVGPDGTARAELTLDTAEVGSDRVACGRRVTCRVVATSDDPRVRTHPVILSFADRPGADYVTARVVVGLAAALGLLLLAGWFVRSTSWDPPAESDSSPIDDADFADLDLEAARFDEPEPVGSP